MWSLILLQAMLMKATVSFAAEDNSLSRSAYLVTLENKHLASHVVQQHESPSLMACSQSCSRKSWCTSTNFKTFGGQRNKTTCELNKHEFDPISDDTKLIDQPGTIFSMFLKGCLLSGCLNGSSCRFNKKEETFTCSCKGQWSGYNCQVGCPASWIRNEDACYHIDDKPTAKWEDARKKCKKEGADLPVIKSSAQNTFILDLMKKQDTVTEQGVWLGMQRRDKKSKRDFYWVDGSSVKAYENWKKGEPNMYGRKEHCGNMYVRLQGSAGKWNDLDCYCPEQGASEETQCPVVLCQKPL